MGPLPTFGIQLGTRRLVPCRPCESVRVSFHISARGIPSHQIVSVESARCPRSQSQKVLTCVQSLALRLSMCHCHFYDTSGEPSSWSYRLHYWRSCSCLSVLRHESSNSWHRYLLAGHRVVVVVSRSKVGPSDHCVDMIRHFSWIHNWIETSSDEWVNVTDDPETCLVSVSMTNARDVSTYISSAKP